MLKKTLWLSLGVLLLLAAVSYWVLSRDTGGGEQPWTVRDGDPKPGSQAIVKYGCSACHVISGIRQATGRVGPKLPEIQQQIYIGGVLPNTPENMVQWIMHPQRFSPGTAMPDLDVPEQDARNMAAYLFEN